MRPRFVLAGLLLAMLAASCATVPITGRRQLNLIPAPSLYALSFDQYQQFLAGQRESTNPEQTAMVRRVGTRIQQAVERFFAEQGQAARLRGYQWEFRLVESDEVNAWCMPGGKVVVYTGLLPVARDEAGLAVVVGHEIAHAVAEHGNERMSQGMVTQLGGMALDKALEQKSEQTRAVFLTVFGLGAQLGVQLPYSRLHESEADRLGLIFMAMAGYDPRSAADFWRRMAAQSGGAPPEFLSTHPSDERRVRDLEAHMPEALVYYGR
ncbi:MAG: M48 family metallopeptidase [Candidatus Eisenbacteria bacterium]|uniref:M48 family metallopeptidase n=1 Tax=Eiseniibacteriota bacterium TaxID=2212470 RepID=A0A938BRF1_UNCEI|nr:M48 family metallopeptidase [Candidatus Eisenbacteria bacterium]